MLYPAGTPLPALFPLWTRTGRVPGGVHNDDPVSGCQRQAQAAHLCVGMLGGGGQQRGEEAGRWHTPEAAAAPTLRTNPGP